MGSGSCGGVNEHMTEGVRMEHGQGEGVRWRSLLRTQGVAHRRDLLRWWPRLSQALGYIFLCHLWIDADGAGDGMGDCVRGDQ